VKSIEEFDGVSKLLITPTSLMENNFQKSKHENSKQTVFRISVPIWVTECSMIGCEVIIKAGKLGGFYSSFDLVSIL